MSDNVRETTVGQLVVERPQRARVFEKFGIDYCCGGRTPLEQACAAKDLSVDEVIAALQAEDARPAPPERDWSAASLAELADHIEQRHHGYLRQELPRLVMLVDKVASVHGDREPRLLKLRAVFNRFRAELESHMFKEEQILFPMCRQLESAKALPAFHCGSVRNPIRVMFAEHDDAGAALMEMYSLTDGFQPPPEACNTYRAMLAGLAELEQDMHRHVHLENNIMFPRAVEVEERLSSACGCATP